MTYSPADDRYDSMTYRRAGRSGLQLPAISLGLWHNFGHGRPCETPAGRSCRRAFDLGVTHFDLANNYGPPPGAAEENFGRMLADDFRRLPGRDGRSPPRPATCMWPGPYGEWGSRKYLVVARSTSRCAGWAWTTSTSSTTTGPTRTRRWRRRWARWTRVVRAGKALYVGHLATTRAEQTARAAAILRDLGTPLLIHQPSYSMLNRWIERDHLLDTLEEAGAGCIAFSPLAAGPAHRPLPGRHPGRLADAHQRVPQRGRPGRDRRCGCCSRSTASPAGRGQSLAQMALAWALRDPRMTSLIIGASSVEQLEDNLGALRRPAFSDEDLDAIDGELVNPL